MLGSYAARYSLIALGVSLGFAVIYIILDFSETARAITPANFLASFDLEAVFVLLAPVTFAGLAYLAGQQRDRAAAYAHEREVLNGVLRSLIHAPDPDLEQTLPQALQQMCHVLSMDAAAFLTLNYGQWTAHAATIQLPEALCALVAAQPWPPTLTPRPRVFDLSADSVAAQFEYRGTYLALVSAEVQPLGWLLLLSRQTKLLPPRTIDLVSTLSDQIGASLVRASQYAAMRRRTRDLEAITHMNRLLLAGIGLDEVLNTIVNSAQVRFGLPYVTVLWVDEAAGEFYLRAQAGTLTAPGFRQKLTEGLAGQVWRTGLPYLVRDTRQEPDYIPTAGADIRSLLLAPLKTGERVIGVMTFQSLVVDAFSAEEALALTALTDQAALAAENASLLIKVQRERQRARAILHRPAMVLLIDTDGRVLLNPAAERLLGVSTPAVIGHRSSRCCTYRDAGSIPAACHEEQSFEATLDDDLTYLMTITTAKDETGTCCGRVVIMRDITYLKRLDQFKSQMVQMASHDLRTPLGVAIGYLDVLKEDRNQSRLRGRALRAWMRR
jgi:GAF domain-containing protein